MVVFHQVNPRLSDIYKQGCFIHCVYIDKEISNFYYIFSNKFYHKKLFQDYIFLHKGFIFAKHQLAMSNDGPKCAFKVLFQRIVSNDIKFQLFNCFWPLRGSISQGLFKQLSHKKQLLPFKTSIMLYPFSHTPYVWLTCHFLRRLPVSRCASNVTATFEFISF